MNKVPKTFNKTPQLLFVYTLLDTDFIPCMSSCLCMLIVSGKTNSAQHNELFRAIPSHWIEMLLKSSVWINFLATGKALWLVSCQTASSDTKYVVLEKMLKVWLAMLDMEASQHAAFQRSDFCPHPQCLNSENPPHSWLEQLSIPHMIWCLGP